jgi:hypothetical protein
MAGARISSNLYLLPPFHTRCPNNLDAIEPRSAGSDGGVLFRQDRIEGIVWIREFSQTHFP